MSGCISLVLFYKLHMFPENIGLLRVYVDLMGLFEVGFFCGSYLHVVPRFLMFMSLQIPVMYLYGLVSCCCASIRHFQSSSSPFSSCFQSRYLSSLHLPLIP